MIPSFFGSVPARIALCTLAMFWGTGALGQQRQASQSKSSSDAEKFDAQKAYNHAAHLVEFGPRPPGSDAIHKAQQYIVEQLKVLGCQVSERGFHAPTPVGNIVMKNIVAIAPGKSSSIVMLAAHYDTVRMANFVGADDGAAGTGVVLELSRHICSQQNAMTVWLVFFDGEEAQGQWTDRQDIQWTKENSTMGSRDLAAHMALSGDLKKLQAMILVDMVAGRGVQLRRDSESTKWLNDLIWGQAKILGFGNIFVDEMQTVGGDDHFSFIKRGVAACDLVDYIGYPYWHTPQDTMDKIDPAGMQAAGQTLLVVLRAFEKTPRWNGSSIDGQGQRPWIGPTLPFSFQLTRRERSKQRYVVPRVTPGNQSICGASRKKAHGSKDLPKENLVRNPASRIGPV
jgi:hypothetical protein